MLVELQYSDRASLSTTEVYEVLGREKEATKGQGTRYEVPPLPLLDQEGGDVPGLYVC